MQFIIVERHDAPVVSFHSYVKAGSVDDPSGQTGMAHMFEHLAFKGTESMGTKDWAAEKKALEAVEEAYDRLDAERNKGLNAEVGKLGAAEINLQRAMSQALAFVNPGDYTRIFEENGGVGSTAATSADATEFSSSLPSNRLELWFLMESQRLMRPVFREFYRERDVMLDEYRERVEANPQNKLANALLATAFAAHPYRNPSIGWKSDIANLRQNAAKDFFDRYYAPGNITMAIVGDVDPAAARKLAERYFGPIQARPLPPLVHTQEPPQTGPKTVAVEAITQPILMVAYHRPEQAEPEDPVLDIIGFILGGGRTGLLYKTLVEEKRISSGVQAISTFPGGRYANLFAIRVTAAPGHNVDENQKALDEIIGRLTNERVESQVLARAKAHVRALFLQRLGENSGLGFFLATYHGAYGNWRRMFRNIDELNRVTAEDVQRIARRYFTPANRTTAFTVLPPPRAVAPAKGVRR